MKKTAYTLLLVLIITCSCSNFLEQSSQDLIRPLSIKHYKELLQGEAYFKEILQKGWFIETMTDNFAAIDPEYPSKTEIPVASVEFCHTSFKWAKDLENVAEGTFTDNFFRSLYKNILTANACLTAIDKVEGGENEKTILKGQASFTRAYAYFILANTYSKPYDESTPNEPCVPLIKDPNPSMEMYPRATMKEIWDLIWGDITLAELCMATDKDKRTNYEINYKTTLILASRIALFMGKYDKVLEFGNKYLAISPTLMDISSITSIPKINGANTTPGFFYLPNNPEIAWAFAPMSGGSSVGSYGFFTLATGSTAFNNVCLSVSFGSKGSLIDLYEEGDRRKTYWFTQPTGSPGTPYVYIIYSPLKASYYDNVRFSQTMRTAEVYLNMAEAFMRQASPNPDQALSKINSLRLNRIAAANYIAKTTSNFSGNEAILNFILDERRRELCFEEYHRWWDLRRTGMPSITHNWLGEKYVLSAKDPAYILNFPKEELDFNKNIIPNQRPERLKMN